MPIRAIARQLKLGRDTVRDIIRGHAPVAKRPSTRKKFVQLEPFRERIVEMVEKHNLTAVRILKEIRATGYTGSYTQLKKLAREIRRSRGVEQVVRFEVPPARQAQVDWSVFSVFGRKVYCFCHVLSYSRFMHIEFFERADFFSFLRGHVNAFDSARGVPREILYDNLKSVVASRVDGYVAFNEKFLAFARYYGFAPRACRVRRPQTKGRCERMFDYILKSFLAGREFANPADLNQKAKLWLDEANRRVHGTTGRAPLEMLEEERALLSPLPKIPFDTSEKVFALCPRDGLVSFQGNRYSVPPTNSRKSILIRATDAELVFECDGKEIARHEKLVGVRGQTKIIEAHYEGVAPPHRAKSRLIEEEFARLGPKAAEYLDGLKRRYGQGSHSQLAKILALKFEYGVEEIHRALAKALSYEAFGFKFIEGILSQEASRKTPSTEISSDELARIHEWIKNIAIQKKTPDAYRKYLHGG